MDSLPGGIGFPQLVHVTRDSFSDITVTLLCRSYCKGSLYLLCLKAVFIAAEKKYLGKSIFTLLIDGLELS